MQQISPAVSLDTSAFQRVLPDRPARKAETTADDSSPGGVPLTSGLQGDALTWDLESGTEQGAGYMHGDLTPRTEEVGLGLAAAQAALGSAQELRGFMDSSRYGRTGGWGQTHTPSVAQGLS